MSLLCQNPIPPHALHYKCWENTNTFETWYKKMFSTIQTIDTTHHQRVLISKSTTMKTKTYKTHTANLQKTSKMSVKKATVQKKSRKYNLSKMSKPKIIQFLDTWQAASQSATFCVTVAGLTDLLDPSAGTGAKERRVGPGVDTRSRQRRGLRLSAKISERIDSVSDIHILFFPVFQRCLKAF